MSRAIKESVPRAKQVDKIILTGPLQFLDTLIGRGGGRENQRARDIERQWEAWPDKKYNLEKVDRILSSACTAGGRGEIIVRGSTRRAFLFPDSYRL